MWKGLKPAHWMMMMTTMMMIAIISFTILCPSPYVIFLLTILRRKKRLSLIVRVNVGRTVVVDSDWRFGKSSSESKWVVSRQLMVLYSGYWSILRRSRKQTNTPRVFRRSFRTSLHITFLEPRTAWRFSSNRSFLLIYDTSRKVLIKEPSNLP